MDLCKRFSRIILSTALDNQHAIQDGCQSGNVIWSPFIKWPPSWFLKKCSLFIFKLNNSKLIHLQANTLSSFIFTYFAVNHTNLPQNLSFSILNSGIIPDKL